MIPELTDVNCLKVVLDGPCGCSDVVSAHRGEFEATGRSFVHTHTSECICNMYVTVICINRLRRPAGTYSFRCLAKILATNERNTRMENKQHSGMIWLLHVFFGAHVDSQLG